MHSPQKPLSNKDFSQYNQKCVCQICTCGNHHCPPKHTKFLGETTNHHDYKPYCITAQKNQVFQHPYKQHHYDPQLLKSSYEKDFQAYKIQPHLNPDKYQYRQNNKPFYDQTQYKKSFLPYQVAVQRPATSNPTLYRNRAKFDGTTTYNMAFSPKHLQKVQRSPQAYERKKIPFEGQTMYHSQFKPHQIQITKPHLCQCQPYQYRQNKFMGESRYHEQFKPYQIEKQCTCPINLMPIMPKSCSPGKQHLNYSSQKRKWD